MELQDEREYNRDLGLHRKTDAYTFTLSYRSYSVIPPPLGLISNHHAGRISRVSTGGYLGSTLKQLQTTRAT